MMTIKLTSLIWVSCIYGDHFCYFCHIMCHKVETTTTTTSKHRHSALTCIDHKKDSKIRAMAQMPNAEEKSRENAVSIIANCTKSNNLKSQMMHSKSIYKTRVNLLLLLWIHLILFLSLSLGVLTFRADMKQCMPKPIARNAHHITYAYRGRENAAHIKCLVYCV